MDSQAAMVWPRMKIRPTTRAVAIVASLSAPVAARQGVFLSLRASGWGPPACSSITPPPQIMAFSLFIVLVVNKILSRDVKG